MKKKLLTIILAIALAMTVTVFATGCNGNGYNDDPYQWHTQDVGDIQISSDGYFLWNTTGPSRVYMFSNWSLDVADNTHWFINIQEENTSGKLRFDFNQRFYGEVHELPHYNGYMHMGGDVETMYQSTGARNRIKVTTADGQIIGVRTFDSIKRHSYVYDLQEFGIEITNAGRFACRYRGWVGNVLGGWGGAVTEDFGIQQTWHGGNSPHALRYWQYEDGWLSLNTRILKVPFEEANEAPINPNIHANFEVNRFGYISWGSGGTNDRVYTRHSSQDAFIHRPLPQGAGAISIDYFQSGNNTLRLVQHIEGYFRNGVLYTDFYHTSEISFLYSPTLVINRSSEYIIYLESAYIDRLAFWSHNFSYRIYVENLASQYESDRWQEFGNAQRIPRPSGDNRDLLVMMDRSMHGWDGELESWAQPGHRVRFETHELTNGILQRRRIYHTMGQEQTRDNDFAFDGDKNDGLVDVSAENVFFVQNGNLFFGNFWGNFHPINFRVVCVLLEGAEEFKNVTFAAIGSVDIDRLGLREGVNVVRVKGFGTPGQGSVPAKAYWVVNVENRAAGSPITGERQGNTIIWSNTGTYNVYVRRQGESVYELVQTVTNGRITLAQIGQHGEFFNFKVVQQGAQRAFRYNGKTLGIYARTGNGFISSQQGVQHVTWVW